MLRHAELPGQDFVLLAANATCTRLTRRIAEFSDAQRVLRALLTLPPFSMSVQAALSYSLHGSRHVYVTAARQLKRPYHAQAMMGHWSATSLMPQRYDSTACSSELAEKEEVRATVARGWRTVPDACLPNPAPADEAPCTPSAEIGVRVPVGKQVLSVLRQPPMVHWWASGDYAVCRRWQCMRAGVPVAGAKFQSSDWEWPNEPSSSPWCKHCLRAACEKRVWRGHV